MERNFIPSFNNKNLSNIKRKEGVLNLKNP